MQNNWLLTPQFFDDPEPDLAKAVPTGTPLNGPHDIPDRSAESLAKVHRPIADFVAKAAANGQRPISLAGDCCAALPVLAGLQRANIQPTLVWIDAHGDFNTPETSPSQFLGGMPLAMMAGRGPQWMCDSVGLKHLPEDRIWLIDGRDLDPMEREALDASAIRRTGIAGLASLQITGPVWVHLDCDVMDAIEVPGFQYPVTNGPSVTATTSSLKAFADLNQIAAVSVCGWTDRLDPTGATAKACKQAVDAVVPSADP